MLTATLQYVLYLLTGGNPAMMKMTTVTVKVHLWTLCTASVTAWTTYILNLKSSIRVELLQKYTKAYLQVLLLL